MSMGGSQPVMAAPVRRSSRPLSASRSCRGSQRVNGTLSPRRHRSTFGRSQPYVLRFQGYTGTRQSQPFTDIMASIQATRLRKGNLIKLGNDLLRVVDLYHLTPGNKRGFVQCRMRNIRTGTLTDQKFRS